MSILGVGVGVTALLIALALMTGLQGELRDRIIGASAHVYVFKLGKGIQDYDAEIRKLRALPHVVGAAPGVIGKALVTSARDQQAFLTIKGIDPTLEPTVTDIKQRHAIRQHRCTSCRREDRMDGIVLGKDAAESLGVSVGDTVRVLSPEGTLTPIGVDAAQPELPGRRHVQPRPLRVRQRVRVHVVAGGRTVDRSGPRRASSS